MQLPGGRRAPRPRPRAGRSLQCCKYLGRRALVYALPVVEILRQRKARSGVSRDAAAMGLSRASALRSHARQVAAHLSGAVCLARGIALDALSACLRAKALFSTQRKWVAVTSPTLLPAVPGRPPYAILAPNAAQPLLARAWYSRRALTQEGLQLSSISGFTQTGSSSAILTCHNTDTVGADRPQNPQTRPTVFPAKHSSTRIRCLRTSADI